MSKKITVKWVPMRRFIEDYDRPVKSMEFDFDFGVEYTDEHICEMVFQSTNNYSGHIFKAMEAKGLPEGRAHTALSVGDIVGIDGNYYLCEDFGFKKMWSIDSY